MTQFILKTIHVKAYSYKRKVPIPTKATKKVAKKPVVVKRSSVPAPGSMAARWAADSEIYGVRAPRKMKGKKRLSKR